MFADDTNIFCSHNVIKVLFQNTKSEQNKSQRFNDNNLSLNEGKTKLTLLHRPRDRDHVPLQLPYLKVNVHETGSSSSVEVFGVLVEKNLVWEDHIRMLQN